MDSDDPEYDYARRLLVRSGPRRRRAVQRLSAQGESIVDGLGDAHDTLHETFRSRSDDERNCT